MLFSTTSISASKKIGVDMNRQMDGFKIDVEELDVSVLIRFSSAKFFIETVLLSSHNICFG